ncbi:uncharacterized protein LOC111891128 [Lactuca sativa]|uniref:uncharacterized protein LOC111891128 n=1 Tax=Lactuca sativa TaxID=4236 RepID=UPI0022AF9265|nr:uncharacterized protein LOC111891128 [Lactuca sativa]
MDDGIDMQDLHGGMDDILGPNEDLQGEQDDGIHMEVDSEPDECIPMNKTKDDEFLSKLCPKEQVTPHSPPREDTYDPPQEDECRRAKKYAIELIEGTLVEHYAKSWSYGEEIRRSNPGSTVKIDVISMPDGKNYFSKLYLCFDGLKQGWRGSCIRFINLDGCFLKGLCSGELICDVRRDANNHIFPIAWAVVCIENKENWKWFLENLRDDLQLDNGFGLLEVVKEILPTAEHRQCARHIVANFRKRFSGVHYETMFWKASNASTEPLFNAAMKEIEVHNHAAFAYLMETNPKSWSRAFFQKGKMCDAVENGLYESSNNVIRDARKKPIITMLEDIRLYVMERIYNLKIKGISWPDYKPCPAITLLPNQLKKAQRYWQVLPSGLNQFETRNMVKSYVVDLDKKTSTFATISFLNRDVGGYVDTMFYGAVYKNTYKYLIQGMNGSNMCPPTDFIPPLPPMKRRMQAERPQVQKPEVGRRPKLNVKKRKTGVNEKGEGAGGINEKGEGAGGVNEGQKGQGEKSMHEGQKGQRAEILLLEGDVKERNRRES